MTQGPAGADRPDEGLARHQRLTRTSLFNEAYEQQRKWAGRFMVLWLRSGEGANLRLGVVSSRKVGPAVARARARRRLREVYRRQRSGLAGAYDVVLVARAALVKARWDDVVKDFRDVARRAGLLKQ